MSGSLPFRPVTRWLRFLFTVFVNVMAPGRSPGSSSSSPSSRSEPSSDADS